MKYRNQIRKYGAALVATASGLVLASGTAVAAVPTAMTDAIDTLSTDAMTVVNAVIPVVATIFGALILIKIFKRAGNKV
jgi:short subunit fatty acids transporter